MCDELLIISIGKHTRAGDALAHALCSRAFASVSADALTSEQAARARLLFVLSSDENGACESLRSLILALKQNRLRLDGAIGALLADESGGGALHDDALALLLAANRAGCALLPSAALEAAKDLQNLPFMYPEAARGARYPAYLACAHALVERLTGFKPKRNKRACVRFVSTLHSEGLACDWRDALTSALPDTLSLTNDERADATILLCQNERAMPDAPTLAALDEAAHKPLRVFAGATHIGADSFACRVIDRACLQGACALPPRCIDTEAGLDAQALLSKRVQSGALRESMARLADWLVE